MISKYVNVNGGSKIKIIASKASPAVMDMAKSLVTRIYADQIRRGARPKVIQRNKRWLSYRINRRYRLLVKRRCSTVGPYYCMSHNEFDNWVNHH
ncbi:hypothetical protein ACP3VU_01085 [Vibrio sp. PNB23_22_6]|uniref:ParE family toxin-like protein n=1 Tax=Vibrio TaxID=662 RepID=UPI004067B9E8